MESVEWNVQVVRVDSVTRRAVIYHHVPALRGRLTPRSFNSPLRLTLRRSSAGAEDPVLVKALPPFLTVNQKI